FLLPGFRLLLLDIVMCYTMKASMNQHVLLMLHVKLGLLYLSTEHHPCNIHYVFLFLFNQCTNMSAVLAP
uniref:Uncharacterized protein n=1 Tax=Aegilops tauschii subsp. strangulata TaxID=200361 RepID=A0A453M7I3_AEGTS